MTRGAADPTLSYVGPGMPRRTWLVRALATTLWLAVVLTGMTVLARYEGTPGATGEAPQDWPAATRVARGSGRHTIVMLAHPRCPCTRASLAELARLMTGAPREVDVRVLFVKPAGTEDGWEKTDLWRRAAAIPGVTVASDPDGREAARFGATVSGQVVAYDAAGRLVFRGGITGGRGHEGDNVGRTRLASLLKTGEADARQSPVFGCALAAPHSGRR